MRYIPQSNLWITTPEDGVEYDMTRFAGRFWLGDTGLAMPPIRRLQERGALQNGVTDLGFRLDPREFNLIFGFRSVGGADYWSKRQALLDIFKPSSDPLKLTVQSIDGSFTRSINFHYTGALDLSSESSADLYGDGTYDLVNVECYAPDPLWYNPEPIVVNFLPTFSIGLFIPLQIPSSIGTDPGDGYMSARETIPYAGTWRAYPELKITGPITDPVITNLETGDKLDFTGTTIAAFNYIVVDLEYGVKTVRDQDGVNMISRLTSDSNLSTFSLEHARTGSKDNTIYISGDDVSTATALRFTYYERFIGI